MAYYAYVRASLGKQELSCETQRRIIEEYAFRLRKGEEVVRFFEDPATSSMKDLWNRKAGQELMRAVRKGDHVIVLRMDRLSRSMINFAKLLEAWEKQGVILHVTDLPGGVFDPTNPMARLIAYVLMSFASYARDMTVMRTKETLDTLKASGARHTANAPYGYRWVKHGWDARWKNGIGRQAYRIESCPEEQDVMRMLVHLRSQGYSLKAICEHMNNVLKVTKRNGTPWDTYEISKHIKKGLAFINKTVSPDFKPDPPAEDGTVEEPPEPEEGNTADEIFGTPAGGRAGLVGPQADVREGLL